MVNVLVKLIVADVEQSDVGHGTVRINKATMKELNVNEGGVVVLTGTRKTAATVLTCKAEDENKDIVRADGLIRRNAGAIVGTPVELHRPTNVPEAIRVLFAPTDTRLSVDENFTDYVKSKFSNSVIVKGDLRFLPIFGNAVPLVVLRTVPEDAVLRFTDRTEAYVLENPVEEKPKSPPSLDLKFLLRHEWLGSVSSRIHAQRVAFAITALDKEFGNEGEMLEEAKRQVEQHWFPIDIAVNFYSERGELIGSLPWLSMDLSGTKSVYPELKLPRYVGYREISPASKTASSLMRRCFKTGLKQCPKEINLSARTVFVATPFSTSSQDFYKYAIRPALEEMGFQIWKADEHIDNIDIMCKMCQAIQECSYVVANISDWNANVLFEIGLAYGIGKEVVMVKNTKQSVPVDLTGLEYIDFESIDDLRRNLTTFFKGVSPA